MIEDLESRALLAGNVTVTLTDGVLRIAGDTASNSIEIQQPEQPFDSSWPGVNLQINGLDTDDGPTTINGRGTSTVVGRVKKGVAIFLGGGDDKLLVGNVSRNPPVGTRAVNLPGHVTIGTWNGNDDIRLSIFNGSRVTINAGRGNDAVTLARSNLNRLAINADQLPVAGTPVEGGHDALRLRRVIASGLVDVRAGAGDDTVHFKEHCKLNGGFASDLGDGANYLYVPSTVVGGGGAIVAGSGADIVTFAGAIQGNLSIDLGGDNDRLESSIKGDVAVTMNLGTGDDFALLSDFDVTSLTLDGGEGLDTLEERGTNDFGLTNFTNIEKFQSG